MKKCYSRIYVVGNSGSFAKELMHSFEHQLQCPILFIESAAATDIKFGDKKKDSCCLVYIGGETRDEEKMSYMNVSLPRLLLDRAIKAKIDFLYLSSLSVFGYTPDDKVSLNSPRRPNDLYGATKKEFDDYAAGYKTTMPVAAVYPASIHASKGRSSVEKYETLVARFPIFKYIRFPGNLSYIYRAEVIHALLEVVRARDFSDRILSKRYDLAEACSRHAIPIPRLPLVFFSMLSKVLGARIALTLRMVFRGVEYGDS